MSAPLTIIVTAKNLRFLKYDLNVEVDDTMADMKEDWEAEFGDLVRLYQYSAPSTSRRAASAPMPSLARQLALAASQQTTGLFVMKSRD